MTTNRQVRITGTIRNSAGNPLRGRLIVSLLAPLIDTSTTPHSTLTPEIQSYDIESREGNLNIKLYESETDSIPYSFKFYSIKENGSNGGLLFPEFNTIISDVEKIEWDNLIPTSIIPDELDLGAARVATLLGQEPYLSTIISGSSSINLTNSFTIPADLSGVTVAPSIAFINDGQSATGQIAGIPSKISRSGSTYTLNRIAPGTSTLVSANTRFYIAPLLNSNVAYISASATIAVSGATTVSIAPSDFLPNNSSVTGTLKGVFGTLSRSGSTYTFTPYITQANTTSIVSGDVFYVSSPPGKDAKATITANVIIAVSGATTIAIAPTNYISDGDSLAGSIKGFYGTLVRTGSTYAFTPSTTLGGAVSVTAFVDEFIPGGAPGTAGKDGVATITASTTIAVSGGTTLSISPVDYLGDGGNITGVIKTAFGTLARSGSTYTFTPATTLGGTVNVTANIDKFFPAATPPAVSNPLTLGTAILDGTGNKLTVNRPVYDTEVIGINQNFYGYSYAIADANNKLAFGIDNTGIVNIHTLTGTNGTFSGAVNITGTTIFSGSVTANSSFTANSAFAIGTASFTPISDYLKLNKNLYDSEDLKSNETFTKYVYGIADANHKLAFGIKSTGTVEITDLSVANLNTTVVNSLGFRLAANNGSNLLFLQTFDSSGKAQVNVWNNTARTTTTITSNGNNYPVDYFNGNLLLMSDRSSIFGQNYYTCNADGTIQVPYDYDFNYFGGNRVYHILGTGQSLSLGVTSTPLLSTTQNYTNYSFNPGIYTGNSGITSLVPLVETTNNGTGETIASGMTNRLSQVKLDKGCVANSGFQFLYSAHGASGQAYTSIKKGTAPYTAGIYQVNQGKSLVNALSKVHVIPCVTLIHGENDESISNTSYDLNLVEFQNDYDVDVKAITGQTETVKMLLCQMHSWTKYSHTTPVIAPLQLKAAEDNPTKIFLVCPKYQFNYTDGVHLTNESERWLGEYYGKVYEEVVIKNKPWKPLSPKTVTRLNEVITIVFNVPKGNLVLDTTLVTNPNTYFGFEYADDTTSATIANVAITASDTVQITLSTTPTGTNKKIRYAWTGILNNSAGRTTGARGNLRDSDNYPSLYGNTLYNWCVTFEKTVS